MKFESTFRVKQCDIMEEMNAYFSLGLVTLLVLSSHAMSDPPILQICHVGEDRSDHVDINLNTSLIVGTNGSCSCHFEVSESAELELSFENVTSPKCETLVTLSDPDFETTCNDSYLQSKPFSKVYEYGSGSWIHVNTIESFTHPMSGTIKLRTKHYSNIIVRCFEPSITSQPMSNQTTTPLPTSTTPTSSTTTERTTSAITAVQKTTTKLMSSTVPTSTKPVLSTTERGDVSTGSNTTAPDPGGNTLQVILKVSCVAGSVVAVGVILLAVFCYRYHCLRRPSKDASTPDSREHPTYCDLTNRENTEYLSIQPTESAATHASKEHPTYCDLAKRADTEYEHIDNSEQGNVYKNVTLA